MLLPRPALVGFALALFLLPPAAAQVEHGGRPPSRLRPLKKEVPTARMTPVRNDLLLAEDEARASDPDRDGKQPLRFAELLAVDLDLASAGAWEDLPGGAGVWRLRIHSPSAKSLALVFRRFQLPAGGELFVYDDAGKEVRGAYTELEHTPDGQFAMRPLRGDSLTLEYFEPAGVRGQGQLSLAVVAHDYRGVLDILEPIDRGGGGGGGNCEVDVACPLGDGWDDQINSCIKILSLSEGAFCTGSMLNNTANDGTVLVLSAAHCGNLSTAVFTFNFERPLCRDGLPPQNIITGATQLVLDDTLDVSLVRIVAPQGPMAFPAFLAGWDRTDTTPTFTTLLHHPGGAVKKISRDEDAPGKTPNFWRIFTWDRGVTEGGSSGGPLFDPAKRFIGNLDSGASSCPAPNNDFCTRLAVAWPVVAPYLDPLGTGQMTLDGLDLAAVTPQPFAVTSILPNQIPTLDPGPQRPLRILGAGFPETAEVVLNGVALHPFHYTHSGHSFINIDMPPVPIGNFRLGLKVNNVITDLPLTVVGVTQPVMQTGLGIPNEPVWSEFGVHTYHADVPGHVHYCFWSLSNQPSVHPLLSLGIGNNFADLRECRINAIPPRGYIRVHHPIQFGKLPFGTVVYNQSACIGHGLPLATSNIQQTVFQF